MKYEIIRPGDVLKDFVSHFWEASWNVNTQKPNSIHYVIASSSTEITFAFESKKKDADLLFTSVQGQTYVPNQYSVDGFYRLLGVSLYSHAIPYLFGFPSSELNNEHLSLDTFLGQDGNILNEKIALANSTEQRVRILSDFFINLLRKQRFEDRTMLNVMKAVKKRNGSVKVTELANQCCLSQKQLNRRFKTFTGFNLKMYSRIMRFESAIEHYSNVASLTDLAYLNGYYDQAHFIHEFKSFTGFCPTAFWKLSDEAS